MKEYFDFPTISVIVATFVLFALALVTKGFTHDLLLEAGVFLVSVKLIMMGYKNTNDMKTLEKEILEVKALLEKREGD